MYCCKTAHLIKQLAFRIASIEAMQDHLQLDYSEVYQMAQSFCEEQQLYSLFRLHYKDANMTSFFWS